MLSNALDDECTGRSPCRDCKWHLQGLDKNQCVDKCERLAAYRNSEPWEGLDVPICEYGEKEPDFTMLRRPGKEIIEMEETPVIPADAEIPAELTAGKQKKREYHKTTVKSGSVKQVRGSLNKEAGGTCLIDGCDIKNELIRGVCHKHYQGWRKGKIIHPILGEFTVWQAKSQPSPQISAVPERSEIEGQGSTSINVSLKEKQMSKDIKASYYDAGGIETLDIIKAKLTSEQYKGYLLGCSLKYQCRLMHKFGDKDRIRDAEKAANYSQWLLEAFKG